MLDIDLPKLKALLKEIYAMFGRDLTAVAGKLWIDVLQPYSIEAVEGAFAVYLRTGSRCPFPADILKFLPDISGHIGAEEAWNHAPKTERDCGYVTDQMMTALGSAQDSIDRGDMIGARMAFIESYRREVAQAQAQGIRARYWYSDSRTAPTAARLAAKERHTLEAAERKWIDPQKALNLLSTICAEQGKPSAQYVARLQCLSAKPLQLTNTLPSVPPKLRLVADGVKQIGDGVSTMSRTEILANLPHLKKHFEDLS